MHLIGAYVLPRKAGAEVLFFFFCGRILVVHWKGRENSEDQDQDAEATLDGS